MSEAVKQFRKWGSERNLLAAILVLSVLLRLAAALMMGNQVIELPGTADQVTYHTLAGRILDGHGFTFGQDWWPLTRAGAPTAHWSYLYVGFLVAVYRVISAPLAARLIQVIITGILHPLLAYAIARKVFNPTAGLMAAALTAVYLYFVYYSAALMTEPFYFTAVLATIWCALKLVEQDEGPEAMKHRLAWGVGLGDSLAAAILLRQVFMLAAPVIFLWIFYRMRRKAWAPVGVAALLVACAILPFTFFNYLRFERFVLLNTNSGFAFYWANHPIYGARFEPILSEETGRYQDLVPRDLRGLDEAALDQALLRQGLQFVFDDPLRYLQLSISRIPAYFMFWPSPESGPISNFSRVGSFGVLWPFMLYGVILALVRQVRSGEDLLASPLSLLLALVLAYSGVHLLSWALIRYRLPVDTVLLVFAGSGIVDLLHRVMGRNKEHPTWQAS